MVIQKITNIYSGTSCAVSTFVGTDKSYGVSSTQFNFPAGVCINNAKTVMYVTDASGVRSVAYPTPGNITLVAGSAAGTTGSADGIGTAATFNYPQFIKPEQYGNTLYIGDYLNYRIRKLDLYTSNVTTYAGGVYNGFQDGVTSSGVGMNVNACGRIYGGNPLANTPTLLLTGYGNATGYGGVLALGNSSMPLSNDFVQFAAKLFGSQGGVAQGWLSISTRSGTNTTAGNAYVERVTISNAAGSTATLVGIGCNAPAVTLEVAGHIRGSNLFACSQYSQNAPARVVLGPLMAAIGDYNYCSFIQSRATVDNNFASYLSFWTHPSAYGNDASNRMEIGPTGTIYFSNYTAGTLSITGSYGEVSVSSDRRLKSNIEYVQDNATSVIMALKPARYTWLSDPSNVQIGFIAQDVETVIPEAVDGKKYDYQWKKDIDGKPVVDENGQLVLTDEPRYRGLSDRPVIAMLVKAFQEMTDTVNTLSARLSNVEAQLART
jgi:hypothetical protein